MTHPPDESPEEKGGCRRHNRVAHWKGVGTQTSSPGRRTTMIPGTPGVPGMPTSLADPTARSTTRWTPGEFPNHAERAARSIRGVNMARRRGWAPKVPGILGSRIFSRPSRFRPFAIVSGVARAGAPASGSEPDRDVTEGRTPARAGRRDGFSVSSVPTREPNLAAPAPVTR